MTTAACLALAATIIPMQDGDTGSDGCIGFGAEVAGRMSQRFPRGGTDRGFSLSRSRYDLGMERNGAGARLVLSGLRSGGPDSYIGVAGESIVPQVQVAEARFRATELGLIAAAGLVDDPWVSTDNMTWDLRSTGAGIGEAEGWFSRSDLGATLAWTSHARWVSAATTLLSGEGLDRRERNNGQDASGLVVLRPLAGFDAGAEALEVHAYGREGSWGLGYARDHRAGLRVTHRSPWVAGGVGWLRAWGVAGDAARTPRAISGWGQLTPPSLPGVAWARIDSVTETPGELESRRRRTAAGLGLPLPIEVGNPAPMRLLVGWERNDRAPGITDIAGADAVTRDNLFYVQIDVRMVETIQTRSVPVIP